MPLSQAHCNYTEPGKTSSLVSKSLLTLCPSCSTLNKLLGSVSKYFTADLPRPSLLLKSCPNFTLELWVLISAQAFCSTSTFLPVLTAVNKLISFYQSRCILFSFLYLTYSFIRNVFVSDYLPPAFWQCHVGTDTSVRKQLLIRACHAHTWNQPLY